MFIKRFALAACMFTAATASGMAAELKILDSFDPSYPNGAFVRDEVASKLAEVIPDTSVKVFGPETVSPFEQLEPVQANVFQILHTAASYHMGTTRAGIVGDSMSGSVDDRHKAGVWDALDQHYSTFGLKLLAMFVASDGYHFMVKEKPEGFSLRGLRIRGTQAYGPAIESLDGTNVTMPLGDVYTSLERGLIQGLATPVLGSSDMGFSDQAKFMVQPRFGNPTTYLLMNLDAYEALSDDTKAALSHAMLGLEDEAQKKFGELMTKEDQALSNAGVEAVQFPPDKSVIYQSGFSEGLYALVRETEPEMAEKLHGLATAGGLLPR